MPNPNSPVFPNAIVTDTQIPVANDAFYTNLIGAIDNVQTSGFQLTNGNVNIPCLLAIDTTEVIFLTGLIGNTVSSCVRGVQGTIAVPHAANAIVGNEIFATCQNQLSAEIKAVESFIGIVGANLILNGEIAGGNLGGTYPNPTVASVGSSSSTQIANAVANSHTRNQDTGTTSQSFEIDSSNNGPEINNNAGVMEIKTAGGTGYADLKVENLTVLGAITGRKYSVTFTSQTTVTVTHNLNTMDVIAAVYDGSNLVIGYSSLQLNNVNSITVTFSSAQTGKIVVMG